MNPKELSPDVRRRLFLAIAGEIAKQLDARGISEEKIVRDFDEHKKCRRQ